ncbi:MAG: hypothetical protein QOJ29_1503 [Thermoleophilaceae bacterium]|nr:hypothetical protein [Thermoleophilaceae bacterium]
MEGPREGPLILLFLIATLAASAFVLHKAEADAVTDPKQKAARGEVTGLAPLSLVRPENLRRVLAKVDAGKYPLISNIRVAPDRVNLSVRDRDGYRRYLTVGPGLDISSSDAGVGEDYAVRGEAINVEAPERMLKLVVQKTGLTPAALDYAAASFSENSTTNWYMAMKKGPARVRAWIAERDGSDVRRPGELSSAAKKRNAATARRNADLQAQIRRRVRYTQLMIKRRTRCMSKARDAAGVSRCLEKYQP